MTVNRSARWARCCVVGSIATILVGCSSGSSLSDPTTQSSRSSSSATPPQAPSPPGTETEPPAAHDPDDVPITEKDVDIPQDYAALLARVEQLTTHIRDHITAGKPTKAHRSLDELDIILKKAPEIASRSVPKQYWKEVNLQSKELAAAHNELHEAIDAKQNPDYSAVAERIRKALDALKRVEGRASRARRSE